MTDDRWRSVLTVLFATIDEEFRLRFPIYAVWAIGVILAWRFRRREPRIARVALIALLGFMLKYPVGVLVAALVYGVLDLPRGNQDFLQIALTFAEVLVEAGLWSLVLVAIFKSRDRSNGTPQTTN
jgi:hypothetical protein